MMLDVDILKTLDIGIMSSDGGIMIIQSPQRHREKRKEERDMSDYVSTKTDKNGVHQLLLKKTKKNW